MLSTEDAAVYRWLALNEWQWDAIRLSADVGIGPGQADAALQRCIALGLLKTYGERSGRFTPVDPDLVANSMAAPLQSEIQERQEQIRLIREHLSVLRIDYLEGRRNNADLIEVVPTLDQVRAAIARASAECRDEILSSQPGGNRTPEVLREAMARDSRQLKRGVSMRTLYQHTVRFNSSAQAYVAAMAALGGRYRTVHELFGRLIVFDQELAVLPEMHGMSGAVLVREPSIVHYLVSLFEQTWAGARPYSSAVADGLGQVSTELDATILQLLAAGLKDEAIGRRLGMSLRTVRRHVADIMDELGAESRFQAGIRAAHRGLLDDVR